MPCYDGPSAKMMTLVCFYEYTRDQGTRGCSQCSHSTRTYPSGVHSQPLCEICITTCQLTPFSFFSFEDLELPPQTHGYDTIRQWPWSSQNQQFCLPQLPDGKLPEEIMHERCVACRKGDNSIGHWARWCPVPLIVGKILLEDSHCSTLQELALKNLTATVTVTHIVHQMRRLLIDFGGFRQASAAPHKLARWVHDLGSAGPQQLHPTLQVGRWPVGIVPTDCTHCREHLDGIDFTAPLPLQITSATNQDLEGLAKSTAQPGDELGVLPVGHALHLSYNAGHASR